MSIDINWDTLTRGPDGAGRAEAIRAFIHDRFQQVTLPRFIRSVHVHSFDFGSVPPELEIKDICDPLPDFYEEDEDYPDGHGVADDASHVDEEPHHQGDASNDATKEPPSKEAGVSASHLGRNMAGDAHQTPSHTNTRPRPNRALYGPNETLLSPFFPGASTPGIPGGTSNMNYFHLPLGAGLSGATTPLAAVAGAQLQGWLDNPYGRPSTPANMRLRHAASTNSLTLTPQSNPDPGTRPSSRHQPEEGRRQSLAEPDDASQRSYNRTPSASPHRMREKSADDIQIVAHVRYSGDIKMSLTAEILLDYLLMA